MKILVTGSEGQLGKTLQSHFKGRDNTVFVSKDDLDITNSVQVEALFETQSFDYCINCAAYTNVEKAEDEAEKAFLVNAEGVKHLARVASKHNTILIHMSTDYVFDGKKRTRYSEEDATEPINTYGKSKLKGEQYIIELMDHYFIIRSSWLYAPHGKNFLTTMHSKIKEGATLNVVTSQTGTPTSCDQVAKLIMTLIDNQIKDYGIYHFSALGETTWFKYAEEISKHISNHRSTISPVETYPTKARRPEYSVLDLDKVRGMVHEIDEWDVELKRVISKIAH